MLIEQKTVHACEQGIALLGALVILLILSLLGAGLLNLAGQEAVSVNAGKDAATAQQLADAAGDVAMAWFHSPQSAPPAIASRLVKQQHNATGSPSFFDQTGRSQFVGTAERPDVLLAGPFLTDTEAGMFRSLADQGTIQEIALYGPSKPGLLGTIDVTVGLRRDPSIRQSVRMQMGALELPALRAGVQAGLSLGVAQPSKESPVEVHWGDIKVGGDLIVRRIEDLPALNVAAPITGQSYGETTLREDRWTNIMVGGTVQATQATAGPSGGIPMNVHVRQNPIPGLRLDLWGYDHLKRIAMQHGMYLAVDRDGLVYPQGRVEPGRGVTLDELLRSRTVGENHGLVFIDTLDQTAPRTDNLGTVTIGAPYVECLLVVQGHVTLRPGAQGQSVPVLSPPTGGSSHAATRVPVQLSGVQFNGVLYAAGTVTVAGPTKVYGAVTAEGTIASAGNGVKLEVWHNDDMSRGYFRGVPVVYRAPGTWMARY